MILQHRGNTQVVYMPDIDAGHIVLGESMGLCDIHGHPEFHAHIAKVKYTTDCGVVVDAWKMVGETVEVYVLPDRVKIPTGNGLDFAKALNSFNSPLYRFGKYVFAGKFTGEPGRYTFQDKAGRKITTCSELTKDFPGIYTLMAHLDENNGALFEPVIARYMSLIWHLGKRPARFQPVGYLDLHDYLCVVRDERRHMFSRQSGDALINVELGKNPTVSVTSIEPTTGQAVLSLNDVIVIDREKDKQFRPYVLVANRPFELRQDVKFHWSKVEFQNHSVFLIPVMSLRGTWTNMKSMIDLLSPRQ